MKKIFLLLLALLCLVSLGSADWWDTSWENRKQVTVTNDGWDFNNGMSFDIDTSTPISQGKMNSDCSDLRVIDPSTNSQITHDIDGCNNGNTDIRIDWSMTSGETNTIELYYGNSGANSGSTTFYGGVDPFTSDSSEFPVPDWSQNGFFLQSCCNQNTWGVKNQGVNHLFTDSEPESVSFSFNVDIQKDTYGGGVADRGMHFFSMSNDDITTRRGTIFEMWKEGGNLRFLENHGDAGDQRTNSIVLRSITETDYDMEFVYNELGNGEWRIYVDGTHEITAGDNMDRSQAYLPVTNFRTNTEYTTSSNGAQSGELDFSNLSPDFVPANVPDVSANVGSEESQNQPPNNPNNPSPVNGADPVNLNPTLSVDVSDDDGNTMDVTFHVDTDNDGNHEYTDTDTGVGSGGTASTSLSSLSESQVVDWYVVADDGSETTRGPSSGDWSFTTIGSPDNPSNPSPSDGSVEVSRSDNLEVDVNHPDGEDMTVKFDMDGNSVGSDTVSGSGTASVNPSLGFSEDHSWSVDVDTQGYQTSSGGGTWSFETVHNTGLNSISGPSNDPAPLNPELEASVSHSDPSEQLTVEFVNDDNGNVICSQSGVTDTEPVTCDPLGEAFGDSTGTNYNWRVDLSGDRASESYSSGVQSFTTVSAPTVSLDSPNDGEENVATDSSLAADVSQAEGLQLNTVITLEDNQGNFVDDYSVNSNPGQITFSDPNLKLSENYQWYADTSIVDSTYSQSDTSSTRSFSTEHDFRVDGVYPSDGREAVGVNDTIDVEVFHSSDRNIDVEFYFGDTASGTPDVTKTVTSSGSAVNATVDTENFDGFGEETGTTYNWSYVVSDGASDTSDITGEGLSFTTVHRPELSLNSPTDGETNVDIDGSLDIGVQQDDNIDTGVTAQLNNLSGSEAGTAVRSGIIGTEVGATASFPLDNFDFVEAGETYSYNATGEISNPADQVSSTIQSSTGLNTFTVSPKPEVTGIEPANGKTGTPANPLLNVTVDHDESDQMTVEFYDWEKTGSEALIGSDTVAAGDTASVNISDEEIGDSPEVYRWYVNVTTESGTSWNNSADPYEFTVASIGSVDFDSNTETGVNLNPDNAADQGLDTIVGQETIVYQVSNDIGADMAGIAFNVSNSTDSEVFGEVDDVESGSSVTVDLGESSLIEEDQEGYEIYAFYQEAGTDFTGDDFRSDKIEFSTHVAEVEWVNPGQPGNQPINEYRVYHNNQSGEAFSNFDYVGSISDDDSGSFTAGVANLELGESSSNECFRMVSWNVAGESNPTSEQCVGVVP